MSETLIKHQKFQEDIRSARVSLTDLKKMYISLREMVEEQADLEISKLVKPENESQVEWEKRINSEREKAFKVTVSVYDENNTLLYGDSSEIFSSELLPKFIKHVYMTNSTAYGNVVGRDPDNKFSITFEFSRPKVVDNNVVLSGPTPNGSNFAVEGRRDSWVHGVSQCVNGNIFKERGVRKFIHMANSYDVSLMLVGFPISFYILYLFDGVFGDNVSNLPEIFESGLYVFVFFVSLWVYRIMFGYLKWLFPVVELEENPNASGKHKLAFGAIVFSAIGGMLYDALRSVV